MLLLEPRANGTVAERKIFPINIMSATVAPKQAIVLGKNIGATNSHAMVTPHNPRSDYGKDESVMETPMQASSH